MSNEKQQSIHMELSERLKAVTKLVTPGSRVADIGTDHGYVPVYLILTGTAMSCIAMDVRKGPLMHAQEHIEASGLEDVIQTRISDGLANLQDGDADTIICAGMGGKLMQKLLRDTDPAQKGIKEMILQPQSECREFRRFLRQSGYCFLAEEMILEEGKFYPMMKVRVLENGSSTPYDGFEAKLAHAAGCEEEEALRVCDRFGPFLIRQFNMVLYQYLVHGDEVCDTILAKLSEEAHPDRYAEIALEKEDIQTALVWYGSRNVRLS